MCIRDSILSGGAINSPQILELSGVGRPEILKKNNGKSYFLGGIYDYEDRRIFENIFECGDAGLKNPKKELISATKKLVNQITI